MKMKDIPFETICYNEGFSYDVFWISKLKVVKNIADIDDLWSVLDDNWSFSYADPVFPEFEAIWEKYFLNRRPLPFAIAIEDKKMLADALRHLGPLQMRSLILFLETEIQACSDKVMRDEVVYLGIEGENYFDHYSNWIRTIVMPEVYGYPFSKKNATVNKSQVVDYYHFITSLTRAQIVREYTRLVLKRFFGDIIIDYDTVLDIVLVKGKLKVFALLKLLMGMGAFAFLDQLILKLGYTVEYAYLQNREMLAKELGLAGAMLQRRMSKFENDLNSAFMFLTYFQYFKATVYDVYHCASSFEFNGQMACDINAAEGTNFTTGFMVCVFDKILPHCSFTANMIDAVYSITNWQYDRFCFMDTRLVSLLDIDFMRLGKELPKKVAGKGVKERRAIISDFVMEELPEDFYRFKHEAVGASELFLNICAYESGRK